MVKYIRHDEPWEQRWDEVNELEAVERFYEHNPGKPGPIETL